MSARAGNDGGDGFDPAAVLIDHGPKYPGPWLILQRAPRHVEVDTDGAGGVLVRITVHLPAELLAPTSLRSLLVAAPSGRQVPAIVRRVRQAFSQSARAIAGVVPLPVQLLSENAREALTNEPTTPQGAPMLSDQEIANHAPKVAEVAHEMIAAFGDDSDGGQRLTRAERKALTRKALRVLLPFVLDALD